MSLSPATPMGARSPSPTARRSFRRADRLSRSHSRGRFELPGTGPLFVSRGIGCSNLPLRINADPELVMLTLKFV